MNLTMFGYGGHAREVACQINKKVTFFIDDYYYYNLGYFPKNVMPISSFDKHEYKIMVAVSDTNERLKIVNSLPKDTKYFTFIHPTVQIMNDDVEIGEGSFIGSNSILTCNIKLGKHAILNRGNHIGHDSIIGDYFSAMPGSIVSGNVRIGNGVYIGTNSSVKEKVSICDDVVIGLNSGVIRDIDISGVYGGCPVIKIK